MNSSFNRREFLRTTVAAGASLALANKLVAAPKKSLLVFTKSSGWEHDVVKRIDGKPSIVDVALSNLCNKYGYDIALSKDGRIFDSKEFSAFQGVFFFTTGDLTTPGTDKNPPMTAAGKKRLLDAIHDGIGFSGSHAASDTFHTEPEKDGSRYIAYGEKADPYIRMIGAEFITHGDSPRLQTTKITINDPNFPGLEGVKSPVDFMEEWYSLKDFRTDIHVIGTLDTSTMSGEPYQRKPYPVIWARMHGKGRVFYTAMGDRPENWQNEFFLNSLAGGIRWTLGDASATLTENLAAAAPGYADIPPNSKPKKQ